jgi:hypothetical protein
MLRPGTVTKRVENRLGAGEGRVFIKDGFRSYRRTYRMGEVYWGVGTGVALLGIVGWVTWKGAHPDPSLFDMSAALQADPGSSSAAASARGPLPAGLAAGGFREGKVGEYSSDDLYVKINGRAGFFQSFGVKSLHAVTLEAGPASEGNASSIDIEVYDLGESRNAIGAYNGERPPGIESRVSDGSTFHFDRNAAFLARGAYYIRFIGSDESEAVVAEVQRLLELFRREIAGAALPWAFSLFVDQLKLSPSQVTYVKNNAFSFGFARDVYKASLSTADSAEDMEAFVVARADAESAGALARQYQEGFASVGVPGGKTLSGVPLSKDEYLGTFSAALATERWVVGVRGAPNVARAQEILESLSTGIGALPPEVRARALPSADATETLQAESAAGSDEH